MKEEVILLVRNWIKKAENDLKTANDEINTQEPATDTVCFHAQQCVEKSLKAFLIFHQKHFKKTHNIAKLIELCKEIDKDLEILFEFGASDLTTYAVEVRYGEEFYFPTLEEAREAVDTAEKVKDFIISKLQEKGFRF